MILLSMKKALLLIDLINEIIHKDGKLSQKGYYTFLLENNSIEKINELIAYFRKNDFTIIFSNLSFDLNYSQKPQNSKLLSKVAEYAILKENDWSTEIYNGIKKASSDKAFTKSRISSLANNDLLSYLVENGIRELIIGGCSTDLAVLATAFQLHDLDYKVTIASEACMAPTELDHQNGLHVISKFADVKTNIQIVGE